MRRLALAQRSYRRFTWYLKLVTATLTIIFFTKIFIMDIYRIPSISMQPTLLKGDYVIAFKLPYGIIFKSLPKKGEMVLLKRPEDGSYYIKRVIALPGESVDMRSGDVFINSEKIKKVYETDPKKYKYVEGDYVVMKEFNGLLNYSVMQSNLKMIDDFVEPYRNSKDGIFLLGDNRSNSIDSRNWGEVNKKDIIGKVSFIWFSVDPIKGKIRWERIGTCK
jgi:signal peptidase I